MVYISDETIVVFINIIYGFLGHIMNPMYAPQSVLLHEDTFKFSPCKDYLQAMKRLIQIK